MNKQIKRSGIVLLSGLITMLMAWFVVWARERSTMKKLQTYREDPAPDYESAVARFETIQAREKANPLLNSLCYSTLLTHGRKVERVIVLMHGMTNCPHQYAQFADLFYKQGYNVLMPLMLRNGLLDRETKELRHLTAIELRDSCNMTVDIARGLGEHITYAGISMGGTMAAWVAQNRADVAKAVLIAPALTVDRHLGVFASRLVMYLMFLLPNLMTQSFRPFKEGPPYNYRGFATRGLAQMMRLGFSVYDAARMHPPAARSVVVVTNAADPSISNIVTRSLTDRWKARKPDAVVVYEFDEKYHYIHDLIDPLQPQQRTAQIYPILLDLMTKEVAGRPRGAAPSVSI